MQTINEIWKEVKGHQGRYVVSNRGRVKSMANTYIGTRGRIYVKKEQIMVGSKDSRGYPHVLLSYSDKPITYKIHRLVATAFIDNPENKLTVNHKDGDRLNNFVENLEWMTNTENVRHAFENNIRSAPNGDRHGMSKLKDKDIPTIRKLLSEGKTLQYIADAYGVSTFPILNIRKNRGWKHVPV